ncbi:Uncharacterised protein [Sphingobacterium multivorum]|uniref:Uncharacterized protein n=1 Tax=Sphingobacterium multivorum TaxID=28454 RepID=A0A2X2ITJ5_SPHMU|nr:Uncharacterised protein [Sphingobacterium multivorum]
MVLPDGRVDLFFTQSATEPFHMTLLGIQTKPGRRPLRLCDRLTPSVLTRLQSNLFFRPASPTWWTGQASRLLILNFSADDLNDFDLFCAKATKKYSHFCHVKLTTGTNTVRPYLYIKRGDYNQRTCSTIVLESAADQPLFRSAVRITAKAYCNIIRFRASFQHIKKANCFHNKTLPINPILLKKSRNLLVFHQKNC